MSAIILDKMLDDVEILEADELYRLRDAVQRRLAAEGQETARQQEAFQKALQSAGLTVSAPSRALRPITERPLFEATGKPVSETIIEERRYCPKTRPARL